MSEKCANPKCRHAPSMHNSLGYCRSKTTPDRSGDCVCTGYTPTQHAPSTQETDPE